MLKIQVAYIDSIKDDHKKMKAFAFYLKVKTKYKNSVIYNYSPGRVAKEFCMSYYEVRKYLDLLCDMDLCIKQKKNVLFAGFKKTKIELSHRAKINVHFTDKIHVVVTKLRNALLRFHIINKQKYIKDTYSDLDNLNGSRPRGEYNKLIRKYKKLKKMGFKYEPEKNDSAIYAGYRRMANVCGVSTNAIRPMLKKLSHWNYIKGWEWLIEETNIELALVPLCNEFSNKGRYFIKEGKVCLFKGTSILL